MGLRSFLDSARRLMQLAKKPGREELWLSIKICFLGVLVIGILGFIIKMISGMLQNWSGPF
jgi:protein translocase SEC61 complex gamma subunit